MGRKKISVQYIPQTYRRNATYKKRMRGLKNKVYELSVLCGVEVELSVRGQQGGPELEHVVHSVTVASAEDASLMDELRELCGDVEIDV